mgnify:FL=1
MFERDLRTTLPVLRPRNWPRFIYHKSLEPNIWTDAGKMNKLVSNSLQLIAWGYIRFMQRVGLPIPDECIRDIFIHGSTTNYYYDENSDIDICIVADLSPMREKLSGIELRTILKSMQGAWMRNYRLRVCGRGIDIEVVEVTTPKYGPNMYKVGSAYSIARDEWIRHAERLSDEQIHEVRTEAKRQYREIRRMFYQICRENMQPDFIETFLKRLMADRKASYAEHPAQPVTAETMAFRMARRRGIQRTLGERATKLRSRNFNVEKS